MALFDVLLFEKKGLDLQIRQVPFKD